MKQLRSSYSLLPYSIPPTPSLSFAFFILLKSPKRHQLFIPLLALFNFNSSPPLNLLPKFFYLILIPFLPLLHHIYQYFLISIISHTHILSTLSLLLGPLIIILQPKLMIACPNIGIANSVGKGYTALFPPFFLFFLRIFPNEDFFILLGPVELCELLSPILFPICPLLTSSSSIHHSLEQSFFF